MAKVAENKRIILSLVIMVVLVLTLIPGTRGLLFEKHLFKVVDSTAEQYVEEGLLRAAAAFATARTFNAIVSVFQESQLQLEPGGVGVSLALGAALDPANDLVERFSWIMLASLTSLGVQKVLIEITPFVSVQIFLTLALVLLLVGLWIPMAISQKMTQLGKILLLSAILIRFAIPTIAYLNQQVYLAFLEDRYDQSMEALGQTVTKLETEQITNLAGSPSNKEIDDGPEVDESWWGNLKSTVNKTVDQSKRMLDIKEKLDVIKQAALEIIDKIVDLIIVFVLSTIVLPMFFLWGVIKLGSLIIDRGVLPLPSKDV